jgi:hypothetical protein
MWSRRFLWVGLASGVGVATMVLASIWFALFVASGDTSPSWTIANSVKLALPGLIVYPACWYGFVFRERDYSLSQTLALIGGTYGVVTALVSVLILGSGIYATITILLQAARVGKAAETALFVAWMPIGYAIMLFIGMVMMAIPYIVIATPMALLHRWLLLKLFARSVRAEPLRASVTI